MEYEKIFWTDSVKDELYRQCTFEDPEENYLSSSDNEDYVDKREQENEATTAGASRVDEVLQHMGITAVEIQYPQDTFQAKSGCEDDELDNTDVEGAPNDLQVSWFPFRKIFSPKEILAALEVLEKEESMGRRKYCT